MEGLQGLSAPHFHSVPRVGGGFTESIAVQNYGTNTNARKTTLQCKRRGVAMQNFGILTQNLCNATKKNGNAKLSKKQNACNAGFVHIDCAGGITLQCNTIFLAVQKKINCSAMVWLCCHFGSSEEIATAMLASPDTHLQRQPHGSLRPLARFKHRRTKRHSISARIASTPLKGVNSE